MVPKPESEIKIIDDLLNFVDNFFEKEEKYQKRQQKRKEKAGELTSEFKMAKEQEEEYYMNTLQKLIRERKKIPKEERVKMRQDSIDEINTTDLENWVMRPDLVLWEKPFNSDSDEVSDSELDTFEPRIMD
jgi:hypothetical protein